MKFTLGLYGNKVKCIHTVNTMLYPEEKKMQKQQTLLLLLSSVTGNCRTITFSSPPRICMAVAKFLAS